MQFADAHPRKKAQFVLILRGTLVIAFLYAHSNAVAIARMGEGILGPIGRTSASIHDLLEWRVSTFPDGFPHYGE